METFIFLAAFAVLIWYGSRRGLTSSFEGTISHVGDGDSIRISQPNGNTVEVRLFAIDAPEFGTVKSIGNTRHDFGRIGGNKLRALCLNQPATATIIDTDKYGRKVCIVKVNGIDLGEWMVLNGYAKAFQEFSRRYAGHERIARKENRGFWEDGKFLQSTA